MGITSMVSRISFILAVLVHVPLGAVEVSSSTDELTSRELIAFEHLQGEGPHEHKSVYLVVIDGVKNLTFARPPRDGDAIRLKSFEDLGLLMFTNMGTSRSFPEARFKYLAGAKIKGIGVLGIPFTDEGLRILKEVAGLKMLSLDAHFKTPEDIELTPQGLRHLHDYPVLEAFKLSRVQITDECLEEIAKLKRLTHLFLYHSPKITDAGIAHLSSMSQLQRLTMVNHVDRLTSGSLIHLQSLTNLTQLGIGWMDVETEDLAHLQGLSQLQSLALDSTNLTDAGLEQLTDLQSLTTLSITRTQVSDAGMATLGTMKQLQTLNLEGNEIGDAGLARIADLPKLKELDVSNTSVTDAGLAHLAKRSSLVTLRMSLTSVGDPGVSELRSLTKLEWLDLNDTKVSDAGLAQLQDLQHLEWLLLGNTQVSDQGLKVLYDHSKLRHLVLRGTKASSEAVQELQRRLPNCDISY